MNSDPHSLEHIFIALQIIGGSAFLLIVCSAFVAQYRGGNRHPTFFNFCFSWIVFCISFSLLFLAGQQFKLPEPDHGLCMVQSALVYAAPPLASSATVCLVTHLMLNISMALSDAPVKQRSSATSVALVILPWVAWIPVFVGILLFAFHHPELVERSSNGTYCIIVYTALPKLTSIWSTLGSVVLVVEELIIGVLLYRNRGSLAGIGQSMAMAIRIGIFTIVATGAIVVALLFTLTKRRGVQFDVLIACIPFSSAIIFGSQKDLLWAWMFWKRHNETNDRMGGSAILSTIVSSRITASVPEPSTQPV